MFDWIELVCVMGFTAEYIIRVATASAMRMELVDPEALTQVRAGLQTVRYPDYV